MACAHGLSTHRPLTTSATFRFARVAAALVPDVRPAGVKASVVCFEPPAAVALFAGVFLVVVLWLKHQKKGYYQIHSMGFPSAFQAFGGD